MSKFSFKQVREMIKESIKSKLADMAMNGYEIELGDEEEREVVEVGDLEEEMDKGEWNKVVEFEDNLFTILDKEIDKYMGSW